MTEQEENELICEKLLGWKRYIPDGYEAMDIRWKRAITLPGVTGELKERTPAFRSWADAGLILDQFESRAPCERVDSVKARSTSAEQMMKLSHLLWDGRLRPSDIRAAALEWLKVMHP